MKTYLKQCLSVILIASLIGTAGNWAAAVSPDAPAELAIPYSLGYVTNTFKGASSSRQVILIQDLHANYDVQKKIAGILSYLTKNLSRDHQKDMPFSLAVEGASGPIDSSILALFPDQKLKQMAGDYLMREGELTGAEYFAVMRGIPNLLMGVENDEYYKLHRDLFRKTLQDRVEMVGFLKGIEKDLVLMRARIYSNELKRLQHRLDGFEKGRVSSDRMSMWLAEAGRPYGIDITGHSREDISNVAYIVKMQMASTREEKDLVQVEHDLPLLLRVADLQATEPEVRSFGPRLNQFVALCHSLAVVSGMHSFNEKRVRDLMSSSIDYYALALMRNKPMVDNALTLFHSSTPARHTVVLVAGGFHTRPITQLLRDKNISYEVITPVVKEIRTADQDLYAKRLSGDLLTPQEVMESAPALMRQNVSLSNRFSRLWSMHRGEDDLAVGTFLNQKPVRQAALAALRVASSILARAKGNRSVRQITTRALKMVHNLALSMVLLVAPHVNSGQWSPAYAMDGDAGAIAGLTDNPMNTDDALQGAAAFVATDDESAASHRRVQTQADLQARIDAAHWNLGSKASQKGMAAMNMLFIVAWVVFGGLGLATIVSALVTGAAITWGFIGSVAGIIGSALLLFWGARMGISEDRKDQEAIGNYFAKESPYQHLFMVTQYKISRGGPFQSKNVQSFMDRIRLSASERRVVQKLFYQADGTPVSSYELDLIDESLRIVRLDRDRNELDKLTADQILREVQAKLHSPEMDRRRKDSNLMYATESPRAMNAAEMFRLGEWGLAWRMLFYKGSPETSPSIEPILRQFAQSIGIPDINLQIELDPAMGRGQGASVVSTVNEQGQVSGLHFRVNAHLDPETMRTTALHEMMHVLMGPKLAAETEKPSFLERMIRFFFRLIGISDEERLVTRATRQFLNSRPELLTKTLHTALQAEQEANQAEKPLSKSSISDSVMTFLLGQLSKFADPNHVRQELAARRQEIIGTAA